MKTLIAYRDIDGKIVMAEPYNMDPIALVSQQGKARLMINSNEMPKANHQPILAVLVNN